MTEAEGQAASRVAHYRETVEARRTDRCLTATCAFRVFYQTKRGRQPRLGECPTTCPYHPDHVKVVTSSPGRTFWRAER